MKYCKDFGNKGNICNDRELYTNRPTLVALLFHTGFSIFSFYIENFHADWKFYMVDGYFANFHPRRVFINVRCFRAQFECGKRSFAVLSS